MHTFADLALDPSACSSIGAEPSGHLPGVLPEKTFHWLDGARSQFRIAVRRFGGAEISEILAPPVRVTQSASSRRDMPCHLVCLLDGHNHYRCETGEFTQASGDIVLINGAEACEMKSGVSAHLLRWSLPNDALAPMLPTGELSTTRIPGYRGIGRVLHRHALELAREAAQIPLEAQRGLLLNLCSLVAIAIAPPAERYSASSRSHGSQMRHRIFAYIEQHLHNPNLNARSAATDLGLSARRLHSLLEECSLSFSDLVARRRVQQSLGLLERRGADAVPIAEIAFLSGFEDLSTYYRRFRRYMHTSPGDWRKHRP